MKGLKASKNAELLEWIAWGREKLLRAGIEEAQEECERILMKVLGCARSELFFREHEVNVSGARDRFLTILEKRTRRIPLAYLLNEAGFWREILYVDERCLIPRPETEILVEQVLKKLDERAQKKFSFLDIGTGSGAIAIAILLACRDAKATLLDVSGDALEVARENLRRYELEDRAERVQGDLFEPFLSGEKWDLIVSNPPYLSEADWNGVQEELKFEPKGALDGGKDGLDFYRKIIAQAKDHLVIGGLIALEVGLGQAEIVSTWLHEAGYDSIQRFNDHLQIERVITARRNS
jgi:release factor glutamine methyltransferase